MGPRAFTRCCPKRFLCRNRCEFKQRASYRETQSQFRLGRFILLNPRSKLMFRKLTRFSGLCLVLLLMSPSISFSQGQNPPEAASGHFFMVTELKIPLGQVSEFMKYWQTVFVPLEKSDPDLISSTVLRHRIGPTDYTVFLIQEFKDMA